MPAQLNGKPMPPAPGNGQVRRTYGHGDTMPLQPERAPGGNVGGASAPTGQAPIDVILVWGRPGSGKTLFGLNSPYKPILVLDTERSAKLYQAHFQFDWKDCVTYGGPEGLASALQALEPGQYGTLVIDTATQWCEWVARAVFAREAHRAEKQSQLVWGLVKGEIRQTIQELLNKVQVIVFTAHDRARYGSSGEREPKVLDPIMEYATVAIQLVRDPNQRIPRGAVTKSRILALPPQLPKATWEVLLHYVTHPADWANLKAEERVPEEVLYPALAQRLEMLIDAAE